mmetsp:Transcript_87894/g.253800  ORF Transcript_87894/g.253800 Transcript_87894/m.253800 type:complete len:213 (-) Transcript_87894:44-682(-)
MRRKSWHSRRPSASCAGNSSRLGPLCPWRCRRRRPSRRARRPAGAAARVPGSDPAPAAASPPNSEATPRHRGAMPPRAGRCEEAAPTTARALAPWSSPTPSRRWRSSARRAPCCPGRTPCCATRCACCGWAPPWTPMTPSRGSAWTSVAAPSPRARRAPAAQQPMTRRACTTAPRTPSKSTCMATRAVDGTTRSRHNADALIAGGVAGTAAP